MLAVCVAACCLNGWAFNAACVFVAVVGWEGEEDACLRHSPSRNRGCMHVALHLLQEAAKELPAMLCCRLHFQLGWHLHRNWDEATGTPTPAPFATSTVATPGEWVMG